MRMSLLSRLNKVYDAVALSGGFRTIDGEMYDPNDPDFLTILSEVSCPACLSAPLP